MLSIIGWAIYGVIVGGIAKLLHSGKEPSGCLPTILIGVVGSYIGGAINYFLGMGSQIFSPSGIVMGVIGGVIACYIYAMYVDSKVKKDE